MISQPSHCPGLEDGAEEARRHPHGILLHRHQHQNIRKASHGDRAPQAPGSPPVDPAVLEAERLGKSINILLNDIIISTSTTSSHPPPPLTTTAATQPSAIASSSNDSTTTSLVPTHPAHPHPHPHPQPSDLQNTPILISNEELANLNHQPHQSSLQHHAGRGKKWQPEEDELLAQAWLRVSEDPSIVGETFWNRVSDEFFGLCPASRRPPRSIQQRWAKLHQSISQFAECYEEQESRLPAETSTESITVEALKLYKAKTDSNFGHYSCWTLLRHTTEWNEHLNKPRMLPLKRKLTDVNDDELTSPGLGIGSSTLNNPLEIKIRAGDSDNGLGSSSNSNYNPTNDPTDPNHHNHHPSLLSSTQPSTSFNHTFNSKPIRLSTSSTNPKAPMTMSTNHPSTPTVTSASDTVKRRLELSEKRIRLIEDLTNSIKRKNEILEEFNKLERETNQIKIMSQFKSNESEVWFKLKQQEILNEFNLKILN